MQRRMSHRQTQYYMDRLLFLMSATALAAELEVSTLTITRWQKGLGAPAFHRIGDFRNVLKDQVRSLHKRNKGKATEFFSNIADEIIAEDEPKWEEPAIRKLNPLPLKDLLIEKCLGKNAKSTDIFKETDLMGYTRMQVYHAADKLGITRTHVKPGRGGYSVWGLSTKLYKPDSDIKPYKRNKYARNPLRRS